MPRPAALAAIGGGGAGVTVAQPTITHTATGQFTIGSGYDAGNVYTLSSGSRSGAVITLASVNQSATVTAAAPKGLAASASRYIERKAYTYGAAVWHGDGTYYTTYSSDGSNGGTYYDAGAWDGSNPAGFFAVIENGYYSYDGKNATPSGYSDSFSEWWKVT